MIIAISANGKGENSSLERRFGRCPFYAFFDTEKETWSFLPNPGSMEGSGAGVKAAQFLLEQNPDVLLTGDVGPNASSILKSAEMEVYSISEMLLTEALEQYRHGNCSPVVEATVSSHAGLDSSSESRGTEHLSQDLKVAVATEGTEVAQHFGRCSAYTLVDIEGGAATNKTTVLNPGHQPGFLPRFLAEKGVNCVIAGGMGPRAQNLFAEQEIKTIIGVTGPVEEAINSYIYGSLAGGESLCEHGQHGEHHDCHEE